MTITDRDVRGQVAAALTTGGEGVDIDAVTRDIVSTYGLVDIDSIESEEFWELVRRHDATQR